MALIKCPECGKKVSENAKTCPICGEPIAKKKELKTLSNPIYKVRSLSNKIKIIIALLVLAIIVVIPISIIFNNKLTNEEQYAVDYLLKNSSLKPNQTEIHKVWIYTEKDEKDTKYYFAYDILIKNTFFGDEEIIYGNETGLTQEQIKELVIRELRYDNYNAPAKEKGKQLNEKKIQKAWKEQY